MIETKTVRLVVDPKQAIADLRAFKTELKSIGSIGRSTNAANDNFKEMEKSIKGASAAGGKLGSVLDEIRGRAASASPEIASLVGGLAKFGPTAAIIAGVGLAIFAVGSKAIDAASKVEIWKANLLTVTGSAQKAQDSYAALVQFASKTPFDLSQSVEGFIKLRTLGLHATEGALTSFGNTAAAMGKPLSQMIEAVADAATGEFERLKEFGIKSKQQGDQVSFTFNGTTTTVAKNSAAIQKYLESIGNTKFAGAMARQMDTISGAASNVEDAMDQMWAGIGGGALGASFKGVLQTIAAGITAITPLVSSVGNVIGSIVGFVGKLLNGLGSVWTSLTSGGGGATAVLATLSATFNLVAEAVGKIGDAMSAVFGGIASTISGAITSVKEYLGLNQEVSDKAATWADIVHASWDILGDGIKSAKKSIGEAASSMWDSAKTKAVEFGSYLNKAFPGVADTVKGVFASMGSGITDVFKGLEFNPAGIVLGAARIVDLLIGTFRGGINTISVLFDELPATVFASLSPGFQKIVVDASQLAVGFAAGVVSIFASVVAFGQSVGATVASVLNPIGKFIESWVNEGIKMLNSLIGEANKLGAGITPVAKVSIAKIEAPKANSAAVTAFTALGNKMGAAFQSGFGHEAEGLAGSLVGRANRLHKPTKGGGLDAGDLPSGSNPSAGKGTGASDKSAADKAKAQNDFWQKLNEELATSKLFGLELEKQTKELELHKVLGRDLSITEKERVDTLVQDIANSKALTDIKKATFEVNNKTRVAQQRQVGLTAEQAKIQDELDSKTLAALNAGVNIKGAAYQLALADYKVALEKNAAQEQLNNLLKSGLDTAKKYSGAFSITEELNDMQKELDGFLKAFGSGQLVDSLGKPITDTVRDAVVKGITDGMEQKPLEAIAGFTGRGSQASQDLSIKKLNSERDKALEVIKATPGLDPATRDQYFKDVQTTYKERMNEASSEVADFMADKLSQKFNDVANIFNKLGSLVGGKAGNALGAAGGAISSFGDFAKNSKSTADSIVGALGKDSPLTQGIGKAVGGAMAGLEIGEKIGQLGKALGLKHFETVAKIGGAIGGLTGNPLIAAAASVIGGIIETILYKAPTATTTITGMAPVSVTGNRGSQRDAVALTATSVQQGLQAIATQLGGTVGTFAVSLGKREDYFRVIAEGGRNAGAKHPAGEGTLLYNGTDEAKAIAVAIQNAIEDGGITGISGTLKKALTVLGTEAAVQFAQTWASAMDDYDAILDPIASTVKRINGPIDALKKTLISIGDTADDQAKLEQYRQAKLADAMKQQTASIRDILNSLNGDGGAVSVVNQFAEQMSLLNGFKADIAVGKSIDQDAFTAALNKAIGLNSSINGTNTAAFQDNVSLFRDIANSELQNITKAFTSSASDPTTNAIADQTSQVTGALSIANDYHAQQTDLLQQLVEMARANGGGGTTDSPVSANDSGGRYNVNGYQMNLA